MIYQRSVPVGLRGGLRGWLEQTLGASAAPWRYAGHIVRPGGKQEGPHQWTADGRWCDDGRDHEYDIVEGLPEPVGIASAEEDAP